MSRPINSNIRAAKSEPEFQVTPQKMVAEALREFSREELEHMPARWWKLSLALSVRL